MKKIQLITISIFLIITVLNSQDVKDFYLAGAGKIKVEEFNEAIPYLNRAIQLDPKHKESYFARGFAYFNLNKLQEAISDFTKAIELDPKFTDAYYQRAITYYQLNNYTLSLNDLNKAIELSPTFVDSYNKRGNIYYLTDKYEDAAKDFAKSFSLLKSDLYSYFLMMASQLKKSKQDYDNSKNKLTTFIKNTNDEWQKSIAQFLTSSIDRTALLSKADTKEKLCEAHFYIGINYLANGDTANAKASFLNCINTAVVDYTEYKFAKKELERLK